MAKYTFEFKKKVVQEYLCKKRGCESELVCEVY